MVDLAALLDRAFLIATALVCTTFIVSLIPMSRSFVAPPVITPDEDPAPRWRLDR